jgi:predicted dehydrogenase
VTAFTALLNDPSNKNHVPGARVVAAFKGGSPDIESSWSRVDAYTRELQEKHGVTIHDTIEAMCDAVDVVMLESVDGRPHLEQARPVIRAGKPLYIDKPMAGSLKDVIAIFDLARAANVPVFSASSLRFGKTTQAVRNGSLGRVTGAVTWSPCHLDKTHPDLFWYGVHGVESLFTVMGTGCESVRRGTTPEGKIEVTGQWRGGREGVFRESDKGYGGEARGDKGTGPVGAYDGYHPLVEEVVTFFKSGVPPVPAEVGVQVPLQGRHRLLVGGGRLPTEYAHQVAAEVEDPQRDEARGRNVRELHHPVELRQLVRRTSVVRVRNRQNLL